MQRIQLTDWTLTPYQPYAPVLYRSIETGHRIMGLFDPIPATVPGCVHNDLLRAGLIEDPYEGMNALKSHWVSDYWWEYFTGFDMPAFKKSKYFRLTLKGIDYEGSVYLNGMFIGEHKGMFIPFVRDITALLRQGETNILSVLLRNAPQEFGQFGKTSEALTQKSRFTYRWDFSTRLVQIGLYDEVLIECFDTLIPQKTPHITPCLKTGEVKVQCGFYNPSKSGTDVQFEIYEGEQRLCSLSRSVGAGEEFPEIEVVLFVKEPKYWFPAGEGEQHLYTLRISAGDFSEEYVFGFREIEYLRGEHTPEDSLPYGIAVNGRRVYIKGVNIVPFDIMYGRVTHNQRVKMIRLLKEAGINLVRIWGGGLIEHTDFYKLCDENGILIWQDFIQSGSGVDSKPCTDPTYLNLLRQSAEYAVSSCRNHPCLAFLCGGNELQDAHDKPSDGSDANLRLLKEITDRLDGRTLFLPTTASGPREFLNINQPGFNHDVHGPWNYEGTERHYEIYNRSDSILHSEFGVPGMASLKSISRILPPEKLRLYEDGQNEDPVWRFHGEWWDTVKRDSTIFGAFSENELEICILCSQFIQAEGLRYAVEANRRRSYHNVGSIIWQFNEPWPQSAGTNLIEYGGHPKPAYYAVKNAYRRVNPSLQYEKLRFSAGEKADLTVWISADGPYKEYSVSAEIIIDAGNSLREFPSVRAGDGRSVRVGKLSFEMPKRGYIKILLRVKTEEGIILNPYILFVQESDGTISRDGAIQFLTDYWLSDSGDL